MAGASGGSEGVSAEEKKMELVRFLVEELKCDVNGMDVPEGEEWGNHYGTPLNYVAHGGGGGGDEGVVRFLLEVGSLLFFFALSLLPCLRSIYSQPLNTEGIALSKSIADLLRVLNRKERIRKLKIAGIYAMPLGTQSWGTRRSWRFWTNGRRRKGRWREVCEKGGRCYGQGSA